MHAQALIREVEAPSENSLRYRGWHVVLACRICVLAGFAAVFVYSFTALFNFYNRWVTTSGVHPVSDEVHRQHGKRLALSGDEPKNRLAGMRS
jgi:hypothetical protein